MPCFNAAAHISRSVYSALGQTIEGIELIVVNDGSTDESLQILKNVKDPRLKIINQPNRGVSVARNLAIDEARGDYIAFLDTDDTWHSTCLEKLYAVLRPQPSVALAYCGWQNVGLPGPRGKPYIPPDYEKSDKVEHLLTTCPWPIHAALTRREVIVGAGGFDERFSNSEDYRLWLQIASCHEIVRVPAVLAYYHFHDGAQASKNKAKAASDNWLVKREFLQHHPEIERELGRNCVRQLTFGMLLRRGYECYWDRDLPNARRIFRMVIKAGYGALVDWKYMLPAFLPFSLHKKLIEVLDK
ncbi:MAG: glycosyltransferase [Deltaproteobacteria bacterium]|nr:glycosyltransferase [Deltaproteobacteria bacterium]